MRGRAARAGGDLRRAVGVQRHVEKRRVAGDDLHQLVDLVEVEAERDAEALAERRGDEARARRRTDQGEEGASRYAPSARPAPRR